MNRRRFLHLLGIGAVSVAAPKLIFDMGKNSHLYTYPSLDSLAIVALRQQQEYFEQLIYEIVGIPDILRAECSPSYFDADGFACIK